MDGSYLSDAAVVEASRKFVCIRLVTYEDAEEAKFMESVFLSASGLLENTTFGILSPDGKENLVRSGRGPMHAFRSSREMATRMERIAQRYGAAQFNALSDEQLPLMESVDVALNVAACDNLPLVITFARDQQKLDELYRQLVSIAWTKEFAGQFIYAATRNAQHLRAIPDVVREGILFVEPGQYGLSGKLIGSVESLEADGRGARVLRDAIASFSRKPANPNSHIRLGIQLGLDWESEIPETDLQSLRAKERSRGRQ